LLFIAFSSPPAVCLIWRNYHTAPSNTSCLFGVWFLSRCSQTRIAGMVKPRHPTPKIRSPPMGLRAFCVTVIPFASPRFRRTSALRKGYRSACATLGLLDTQQGPEAATKFAADTAWEARLRMCHAVAHLQPADRLDLLRSRGPGHRPSGQGALRSVLRSALRRALSSAPPSHACLTLGMRRFPMRHPFKQDLAMKGAAALCVSVSGCAKSIRPSPSAAAGLISVKVQSR
jgi:hypothetical protein